MLLASTSTLFGEKYLAYLHTELALFFKDVSTITFVPYARPNAISYNEYTAIVEKAFSKIGKKVKGLHTYKDAKEGILKAEAIFVGGGNTFVLVNQLYSLALLESLKETINNGAPYLGCSAGSNIAGINMKTTNDMPVVYPPSFDTLKMVPFNINAHYLDPDPNSTHNGETREVRIKEFHAYNKEIVIGLREGNYILVEGTNYTLKGEGTARIFRKDNPAIESKNLSF